MLLVFIKKKRKNSLNRLTSFYLPQLLIVILSLVCNELNSFVYSNVKSKS